MTDIPTECVDRLKWGRWEYNKAPEDFGRLTIWYSKEQTQQIVEEAEKANFLVFAKVIYPDNIESFISLTPPEVTAIRNNNPHKTNIIIRGFFANIFELWVSKIAASNLLGLTDNKNIKENHQVIAFQENGNDTNTVTIDSRQLQTPSSDLTKEPKLSHSLNQQLPKPSNNCQDRTILLKQAIERLLETDLIKIYSPKSLWICLCDKTSDSNYKIKDVHGSGTKRKITFNCGHGFDYRAAYPHIQKGIEWFNTKK